MWKKTRKMKLEFNAERIFLASEQPITSVSNFFRQPRKDLTVKKQQNDNQFMGKTK